MFWLKYVLTVTFLVMWCHGYPSDSEMEIVQGDREKRTLFLGLFLKNLILQQALNRNGRINTTSAGSASGMMMMASPNNQPPVQSPPEVSQAGSMQSQTPANVEASPQEPTPAPAPMSATPQPTSSPSGSQQLPSQLGPVPFNLYGPQLIFPQNYPFGIQGFQQLPFGPAPPLGAQAGPQGSIARFSPNFSYRFQNGLLQPFQPSAPSQTQQISGDSQPQQPLPPSGSESGAAQLQQSPSAQDNSQQQPSLESAPSVPSSPSASGADASQSQSAQDQSETNQPQSGQEEVPTGPSGPPTAEASQGTNGPPPSEMPPPQPTQGSPINTFPSGPGQSGPSQPPSPNFLFSFNPSAIQQLSNGNILQGLPPNFSFRSQRPNSPLLIGERQRFQGLPSNFRLQPVPTVQTPPQQSQNTNSLQGFDPNFIFTPQTGPSNDQNPSANGLQNEQATPTPPSNFNLQNLDNNLQQQFDSQSQQQQLSPDGSQSSPINNFPSNVDSTQQVFQSPSNPQQANGLFDPRQFAGNDNNVFDFPEQAGNQAVNNNEQQQSQQTSFPNNFGNGLFSPSGQQQFGSSSDPQSNLAFRDQQFNFNSPFQDAGDFQRNLFQRSFFN